MKSNPESAHAEPFDKLRMHLSKHEEVFFNGLLAERELGAALRQIDRGLPCFVGRRHGGACRETLSGHGIRPLEGNGCRAVGRNEHRCAGDVEAGPLADRSWRRRRS